LEDQLRPCLWDADTGKRLSSLETSLGIDSLAMSADGKRALGLERGEKFFRCELDTGKQADLSLAKRDYGKHIALTADGKRALMTTGFRAIVWDLEADKELQDMMADNVSICSVALSPDGDRAVTGRADNTAILWNCQTGKKIQVFKGHEGYVTSVALTPDGKRVVTGSHHQTVILWDGESGKPLQTLKGHTSGVTSVASTANGKRILSGSSDGSARLWDAATGTELCRLLSLDEGTEWIVLAPDGRFDGSKGAERYLTYRITGKAEFVPLEKWRERYYTPGLLGSLMKGEKPR
jgi:WD40 repeat protein